jgi:hypothetical protein
VRVDNKSTIGLIKNLVLHHWQVVRESVENGLIKVEFIWNEEQLCDILTKSFGRVRFHELCTKIGLINIISVADTTTLKSKLLRIILVCLISDYFPCRWLKLYV